MEDLGAMVCHFGADCLKQDGKTHATSEICTINKIGVIAALIFIMQI
jgi:hypothetical protein